MSFNKKILATAIVGGLFAASANAAVDISAAAPASVTFASEIVFPANGAGVTVTNAANALDIQTSLNYAFSNGEVRYARIECSPNVRFSSNSAVTYTDDATATVGTVALGAINGLGTNAISFSVTATAAGVGDETTDKFVIGGDRNLTSTAAATCSYALYDQPSQAASGGTIGRIATASGSYSNTASGYSFTTTSQNTLTAAVEANPSFTQFTTTTGTPTLFTTGRLSNLSHDARTGSQLGVAGIDVTLADLFAATTNITVTGDFSLVQNDNGTYASPATNRVFLDTDGDATSCNTVSFAANALTATTATFTVGATARTGELCIVAEGTPAIPAGSYTASLNAVAAAPTVYAPVSTLNLAAGSIVRNGTELQAPLAQVPDGYLSRLVLTNTGSVARPFTITVTGETGNTIGTANLTGTVPANGTIVRDLNTVMTSFTTGQARRGTLNVTVAGPSAQIQGLYQIVFPSTGALSNHVMVRPGTN